MEALGTCFLTHGSQNVRAKGGTWTARCCRESFRKGRGCVAALVACRPSMADTSFLPASCTLQADPLSACLL